MASPVFARDPALSTKKHLQTWLNLYTTATGLELQVLTYAQVRRLVAVDSMPDELDDGDALRLKANQPMAMLQVMGSLTSICGTHARANESIRILFSKETRHLKARIFLATQLYALGQAPPRTDPRAQESAAGCLVVCDFDEGDALGTVGVRRKLATSDLDPDRCVVVDVVCAKKKTRSGRALLGTLILELLKQRASTRPQGILAIAVSKEGRNLFQSFGFNEVKFRGDFLMSLNLADLSFQHYTEALKFHNSRKYLHEVCWRSGSSTPTRHRAFDNGCR